MQLSRSRSGTVSRLRDPLMRGEVASRGSARLGVGAQDFQALLPKQRSELFRSNDRSEADGVGVAAPPPRHDIAMLCLLALRDEEAREFLREQNWREILAQVADGEILVSILKSDLRSDDAASLNSCMVPLSPPEERVVSSWLLQTAPPHAATMVDKWSLGIRK